LGKDGLRNFALRARTDLTQQIVLRAAELGITEGKIEMPKTVDRDTGNVPASLSIMRDALVKDVYSRGFDRVVEDAACVWFNRFTCLRYMEANGYLPSGIRMLPSGETAGGEPEIIKEALNLKPNIDKDYIAKCRDTGKTEELYRYLLVWQCKQLAGILPFIFKDNYGYEQLLLPDRLLGEGGLIRDMVKSIGNEAFRDNPQITGWLYQYFISKKKDEVFAGLRKNKKIAKEDIPAATQLFTPDWIVKYMVENSLGRLWLKSHPDRELRSKWLYYIEEAPQTPGVEEQLAEADSKSRLSPEHIRLLDPAVGSGHILVYAFDVLYSIYLSFGYSKGDIPKLILQKNLYGLDIDDRAGALACFALMMKARSKDPDIFSRKIELNLCRIQESNGLVFDEAVSITGCERTGTIPEGCRRDIKLLLEAFYDAREYGSIIKLPDMDLKRLQKWCEKVGLNKISSLIKQADIMKGKYHVVVTNPPYMGIRGMNDRLAGYISTHYRHSKYDLFTVFMELAKNMTVPGGYLSLINQHSWMFLSSYKTFREKFVNKCCICSMLHLGSNAFENGIGTIVQTTAFVARRLPGGEYRSVFTSLQSCGSSEEKKAALLDMIKGCDKGIKYSIRISDLGAIPGKPFAYWAGKGMIDAFTKNRKLGELALPRQGMATSDNNRFVRYWYEVSYKDIGYGFASADIAQRSGCKWFPYNKGGSYRKWYGNNQFVVNWQNNGEEIKKLASSLYGNYTRTIKNIECYFKEAITYTFISNNMGARYSPGGSLFDVAGSCVFPPKEDLLLVLAFLCSKLSKKFLYILNPTFNIQVGDIKNLPLPEIRDRALRERIGSLAEQNINISKTDWDFREISPDFKRHPLLVHRRGLNTIEQAFDNWSGFTEGYFSRLRENEEELNRIFIEASGLAQEITPEIRDDDITLNRADRSRDIRSLISYAVGCMFGRYSLDRKGLVYAGGPLDPGQYLSCAVKTDNIIPVMDGEYFQDNILSRFTAFVEAAFGKGTLEENMEYIAQSLGKRPGETAKAAIGRYFLKDFYKDHLVMYNKRPVYWLFDTGRENAFKALVYMHRFGSSTLSLLQRDYVHRAEEIYREELNKAKTIIALEECRAEVKEIQNRRKLAEKRLGECAVYDMALSRAIARGITIDPDDGVELNYSKFQGIGIPGPGAGETHRVNLMAKI
jgi:type II restriction/modification system DNA methylase subunit YeeA